MSTSKFNDIFCYLEFIRNPNLKIILISFVIIASISAVFLLYGNIVSTAQQASDDLNKKPASSGSTSTFLIIFGSILAISSFASFVIIAYMIYNGYATYQIAYPITRYLDDKKTSYSGYNWKQIDTKVYARLLCALFIFMSGAGILSAALTAERLTCIADKKTCVISDSTKFSQSLVDSMKPILMQPVPPSGV